MNRSAVICCLVLASAVCVHGQHVLGRCPFEKVSRIHSGRFVTADVDDILVVQDLGATCLVRVGPAARVNVRLERLALIRVASGTCATVWQSQPYVAGPAGRLGIAPTAWAAGDFNADGRTELLLIAADSCREVCFGPDSITANQQPFPSAGVEQAAACDFNSDGIAELVTIERAGASDSSACMVAVYARDSTGWHPLPSGQLGLGLDQSARLELCGSVRFPDYYSPMPVFAVESPDIRPSTYLALAPGRPSGYGLTGSPFPAEPWFSKTRPLPSGRLDLFNVGDSLVAYGYFVPSARPGGPSASFAALDDGEWRVLRFADHARNLSGPVCRFTLAGTDGWLELRHSVFYFYPGDVFVWR